MVFENVTLFEVHLDDAQFGPETGRSNGGRTGSVDVARSDADRAAVRAGSGADESADAEGSGRGRFAKLAVASVVVSVVAAVAARRLTGRDEDPDFDADSPDGAEPEPYAVGATDETEHVAGPSGARHE